MYLFLYKLIIGWYTFDVTSAVLRWLTVKRTKKSSKISNQLMIEKGRMTVDKRNVNDTRLSSMKRDVSIIPGGEFEKAILYVYSDGVNPRKSRVRRAVSKKGRRGQNSRRKSYRRKGEKNCRLHKRRLDFAEVKYKIILYLVINK